MSLIHQRGPKPYVYLAYFDALCHHTKEDFAAERLDLESDGTGFLPYCACCVEPVYAANQLNCMERSIARLHTGLVHVYIIDDDTDEANLRPEDASFTIEPLCGKRGHADGTHYAVFQHPVFAWQWLRLMTEATLPRRRYRKRRRQPTFFGSYRPS